MILHLANKNFKPINFFPIKSYFTNESETFKIRLIIKIGCPIILLLINPLFFYIFANRYRINIAPRLQSKENMENIIIEIRTEVPSKRESVQVIENFIYSLREKVTIDDEKFYNILIAVTEAINNAIIHGNKLADEKIVKFDLTASQSEVEVTILDQGTGFNPEEVKDPRAPENLFKENGRGVFLIKELSNSAVWSDKGRVVEMKFYL
jgi:serine/threonine-protein kinase RsbW